MKRNNVRDLIARNYLLVLYPCIVLSIVFSVKLFQFQNDINHMKSFEKISCDKIYYGKLSVRNANREWCCETLKGEKFSIVTLNTFRAMDEVFSDKEHEVWYNKETNRVYKDYKEPLDNLLKEQVRTKAYYLAFIFLISVVSVYENCRYNENKL